MANSDTTHPSPLPSDDRPSKRIRLSDPADNDDEPKNAESQPSSPPLPTLLPEMWALVMDFLPYSSVLQSAAVSRSMLHEVMPSVTMLHLDSAVQLHAGIASSRYRHVRDIYIYSLIQDRDDNEDGGTVVDQDTATRAVPFLCNFPRLERVFLGRLNPSNGEVEGFVPTRHTLDEDNEYMDALINAFSGAFRSGALSRNLWVLGLRCPRSSRFTNMFGDSTCLVCHNACKSFPLESVADFECEGSSNKHRHGNPPDHYSEQLYSLDVCLAREEIDGIIIRKRPGGRDLLYSEARFFSLLGRGTRNIVVPDKGKVLYVVKYNKEELGDLRSFIQQTQIKVKMLSSEAVTDAIKRSFAEDERDALPPRDQCYLAENSFHELKRMGLVIDESDFLNADEWDGKKYNNIIRPVNLYLYNWRFF